MTASVAEPSPDPRDADLDPPADLYDCPRCGGLGDVMTYIDDYGNPETDVCPRCRGYGVLTR